MVQDNAMQVDHPPQPNTEVASGAAGAAAHGHPQQQIPLAPGGSDPERSESAPSGTFNLDQLGEILMLMRGDMQAMKSDVRTTNDKMDASAQNLKNEIKASAQNIRGEMQNMGLNLQAGQEAMRVSMKEVKGIMADEIGNVRGERPNRGGVWNGDG